MSPLRVFLSGQSPPSKEKGREGRMEGSKTELVTHGGQKRGEFMNKGCGEKKERKGNKTISLNMSFELRFSISF
jgi:hypothetical protein